MKILRICLLFILICHAFVVNAQHVGSFHQVTGSPFPTGVNPISVAFSPEVSGHVFAAVANDVIPSTISVYSVDITTGAFSPVPGSPFPAGRNPIAVAFSPEVSGHLFAAAVNYSDNSVSVYSVDMMTGVFSPVPGSPFLTGANPDAIAFSPEVSGNVFAAVTNFGDNTVSVYSVDTMTGVFSPVPGSPFATGRNPSSVAFSPEVSGHLFAAVTNYFDNNISVYSVNTMTGAFSTSSLFATGANPDAIAFSPEVSGNLFAAAANFGDSTVSVYSVDTMTGAFSPVPGSPYQGFDQPPSVAFSPLIPLSPISYLFAAVTNSDNTVSVFSVDLNNGTWMQVIGSPFPTGSLPYSVAFSPLLTLPEMLNLFAAVANAGNNNVSVYQVQLPSGIVFAPTVTGVSPNTGPASGGVSVIISGTNFTPSATVNFGSIAAPLVTFVSTTELIVTSPAGSGTVDVTVTTAGGTSVTSPADQFTYRQCPSLIHPPKHVRGYQVKNRCAKPADIINVITWRAPSRGMPPIAYKIFKNPELTQLVGIVYAYSHQHKFKFKEHPGQKDRTYTYYLVSIDETGQQSAAVKVTIKAKR
jgi:6-phosphogluconolactonase